MAHDENAISKENVKILHLAEMAGEASGTQGRLIRSGATLLYDTGSDWAVAAS